MVHVVLGPEAIGADELVLEPVPVPGCLEDLDRLGDYLLCDPVPDQREDAVLSGRLPCLRLLPDELLDPLPLEDLAYV